MLLTDVYERYYVDLEYGEEYRGVYLVRGENVVLVGELVNEPLCTAPLFTNSLHIYPYLSYFNRMRTSFRQFQKEWQNSNARWM